MSLFDGIEIENCKQEEDKVGGGSYAKFDKTGSYDVIIEVAYAIQSKGGALGVTTVFKREDGAKLTDTQWITNKVKQTYYIDKNGEKRYLAGYNAIMSIDGLITGKTQAQPKLEKKKIKVWNNELRKEVIEEKDVLIDWVNKPLTILVHRVLRNKTAQDSTGAYVSIPETVERTEIQHYVDAVTHKTKNETISKVESSLYGKWIEKFKEDYVADKREIKDGESSTTVKTDGTIVEDNPFG